MPEDKQFVGFCKTHTFSSGDEIVKVSFKAEDLEKLSAWKNDKGYVNLNLKRGKNGQPYLERDTWQPKSQQSEGSEGLPF